MGAVLTVSRLGDGGDLKAHLGHVVGMDARITSMLILLFLYWVWSHYLKPMRIKPRQRGPAPYALSLVGTVNIPIIYKSVDWWYSLHQPASIDLPANQRLIAACCIRCSWMIAAFYCLFAVTVLLNMRAELVWNHRESGWLQQLVQRPDVLRLAGQRFCTWTGTLLCLAGLRADISFLLLSWCGCQCVDSESIGGGLPPSSDALTGAAGRDR